MEVWDIYSKALEQYTAKNYDAALKILDDVKKIAPDYRKAYMLEACIWRDRNNPVKEFAVLKDLLPRFDITDSYDKELALYVLRRMASFAINYIDLPEVAVKTSLLLAKLLENNHEKDEWIRRAIFFTNALENASADDFKELYAEYKKTLPTTSFPKRFYNHKKIRVGFLSCELYNHPVMNWSMALLTKLDKKIFKVYCYSSVKNPDNITEYIRSNIDIWRDISKLTDKEAAELILDDEIDILFDLSMFAIPNRFRATAYHPASVQVAGIGYMNSTGLDCFDYFWSDIYCAGNSEAMSKYFSEKIIRLPHSHICYNSFNPKIAFAEKPPCLENGYVTFGSFNDFRKVTNSILQTWKKFLDAVPSSRLILKSDIFNIDDGKNYVSERLKHFDFNLARIEMRPYTSNHLGEYNDVDIALDTFPYTGGVTTCEALYMGVPVVSLYGERHGTRFGLSILKNIGLDELAVDSYDKYIDMAVALANDWELLKILRKNLRGMMKKSPLMNSELYIHDAQEAFIKILQEVLPSRRIRM